MTSEDGKFTFQIKQEILAAEEVLDGIYILRTNCQYLSSLEINRSYKELSQVEDAFKEIKDFLKRNFLAQLRWAPPLPRCQATW